MSSITHDNGLDCRAETVDCIQLTDGRIVPAQAVKVKQNCTKLDTLSRWSQYLVLSGEFWIINSAPISFCWSPLFRPWSAAQLCVCVCPWVHLCTRVGLFIDTFTHLVSHLSMSAPHPNPSLCQHFISNPSNTWVHTGIHTYAYTCVSAHTAVIGALMPHSSFHLFTGSAIFLSWHLFGVVKCWWENCWQTTTTNRWVWIHTNTWMVSNFTFYIKMQSPKLSLINLTM